MIDLDAQSANDVDALKRALWLRVRAHETMAMAEVTLANGDDVQLLAVNTVVFLACETGGVRVLLADGRQVHVETGRPGNGELSAKEGFRMTWEVKNVFVVEKGQ